MADFYQLDMGPASSPTPPTPTTPAYTLIPSPPSSTPSSSIVFPTLTSPPPALDTSSLNPTPVLFSPPRKPCSPPASARVFTWDPPPVGSSVSDSSSSVFSSMDDRTPVWPMSSSTSSLMTHSQVSLPSPLHRVSSSGLWASSESGDWKTGRNVARQIDLLSDAQVRTVLASLISSQSVPMLDVMGAIESVQDAGVGSVETRNWNEEFQSLVASIDDSVILAEHKKFRKLASLAKDFVYAAQTYGKVIISEKYLPHQAKTIKPVAMGGIAGGVKYVVHGILFKFAIDTTGVFGGDDEVAEKVAADEMRALQAVYNAQVPGLSLPLMVLINFRGFRLIASSQLPISDETLVYGSSDAGGHVFNADQAFGTIMKNVASKLLLSEHLVGGVGGLDPEAKLLYGPADIEGHCGYDGRRYMIDFARLFPLLPRLNVSGKVPIRTKFRPEFLVRMGARVSSDAFTKFATPGPESEAENAKILDLYVALVNTCIPEAAAELDADASSRAVGGGGTNGNLDGAGTVGDLLRTDPHLSSPSFVCVRLRRAGINLRFLGCVRMHVQDPAWRLRLLVEMVARAVNTDLRAKLRAKMAAVKVPSEEPYREVVVDHLNLVFGSRDAARAYWDGPLSSSVCGRYTAFKVERQGEEGKKVVEVVVDDVPCGPDLFEAVREGDGLSALFARVVSLAGIGIVEAAVRAASESGAMFTQKRPFSGTDVVSMNEQVKTLTLIPYAEGTLHFIHARALQRSKDERDRTESARIRGLAKEQFNAVLEVTEDPATLTNFGFLLEDLEKDTAGALAYYERALSVDKAYVRALYYSAMVYERKMKDMETAEAYYLRAIEADPNHTNALKDFAHFCYTRLDQADRARSLFARAVASDPLHVKAAVMYARFCLAVGDEMDAVLVQVENVRQSSLRSEYFPWPVLNGLKSMKKSMRANGYEDAAVVVEGVMRELHASIPR